MVLNVLFCYAHDDEKMVKKCKGYLRVLERKGFIKIEDQGNILAGEERKEKVDDNFNRAHIILLFLSFSLLDSDYHYSETIKKAIIRHEHKQARVIPIILRPCDWQSDPLLEKLYPLPNDGKPIATWRLRDSGYMNVVDGIKKVIKQWQTQSLPGPSPEREIVMTQFERIIELVNNQLQPPGRAMATASTLRQLSVLTPNGVTLADLAAGWRVLARPHQPADEAPLVIQRRATCGELADLAVQITGEPGEITRALKAWQSWVTAFGKSDDPRQAAMAKTFAREYGELQTEIQTS